MRARFSILVATLLVAKMELAFALPAQPVPIPENPSAAPQINLSGAGIGSLGYGRSADQPKMRARLRFNDSALELGAAQKLYAEGAVGSVVLGALTTDESNRGTGSALFLHQAFVDYQSESFEALLGRSDRPMAHLVDFPTLRGDDLIGLTGPLNPFSNGINPEEHRYANVGSVTFNQGLKYFENFHVQHLIDSTGLSSDAEINSFGASIGYLGEPGMEALESVPAWGIGFEQVARLPSADAGIHQAYVGGVWNLKKSLTNRWELGLEEGVNWGSDLRALASPTDAFRADASTATASLRYLHAPFGAPAFQLALTAGHKNYFHVPRGRSWGMALTGVKRLGPGFDLVAQYQGQWRGSALANAEAHGTAYENVGELGLTFNFDATFNQHISPRRSLLNQGHGYIRD